MRGVGGEDFMAWVKDCHRPLDMFLQQPEANSYKENASSTTELNAAVSSTPAITIRPILV
jgi:hypothetical protein